MLVQNIVFKRLRYAKFYILVSATVTISKRKFPTKTAHEGVEERPDVARGGSRLVSGWFGIWRSFLRFFLKVSFWRWILGLLNRYSYQGISAFYIFLVTIRMFFKPLSTIEWFSLTRETHFSVFSTNTLYYTSIFDSDVPRSWQTEPARLTGPARLI